MQLEIRNVGIIDEANINLNGITTIAGLNQTGKSTISKSLFAIIDAYRNLNLKIDNIKNNDIRDTLFDFFDSSKVQSRSQKRIDILRRHNIINSFSNKISNYIINSDADEINIDFFNNLKNQYNDFVIDKNDDEIKAFIKKINIIIKRSVNEYLKFIVEQTFNNIFFHQINYVNSESIAKVKLSVDKKIFSTEFSENKVQGCSYEVVGKTRPIYIETESELDYCSNLYNYQRKNLEHLLKKDLDNNISFESYNDTKLNVERVNSIFELILNGHLKNSTYGELSFYDDKLKSTINFGNLASGIKLFTIIQRLVENGSLNSNSVLIIDEPEVNLHPEWQLKCAELLVLLYKDIGVKILLNTHSPYFFRAIEVYLNQYDIIDKGSFYFMELKNGHSYSKNVTDNTEEVYELMYHPFKEL